MKYSENKPPRTFRVGHDQEIELKDCAHIELAPDEQVTFVTESGTEYDVARKDWGYYATPSLNGRLQKFGLRASLVKSPSSGKYNIFLMIKGKEKQFHDYLRAQGHEIVCWLDSEEMLKAIEEKMKEKVREP